MGDNYDRYAATERAIELTKLAVQSGILSPITPHTFANAEDAGRAAAQYLSGFIEGLAERIEKL